MVLLVVDMQLPLDVEVVVMVDAEIKHHCKMTSLGPRRQTEGRESKARRNPIKDPLQPTQNTRKNA